MNKKLIAVAVAGTLAAPVVYADGHEGITPYARVNNAIDIKDSGDGNTVDVSGVSSRFGFKGTGDIGNGLTAFGRYEFSTTTDKEQVNPTDLRLGFVGLSGGFGSVAIGNQWSSYFNSVGTLISPTYSLGYFLYSSVTGGPFRASNTIKYSNSFGPVSLEADFRLNESGEDNDVAEKINGDGYGVGATINPTDNISIALAFDKEEENSVTDEETGAISLVDDTERSGVAAKFGFGNFGVSIGYQHWERATEERDLVQLYLNAAIGEKNTLLLGFGQANVDVPGSAETEPTSAFLGFYHNMGGGLKLYVEATSVDYDDGADNFEQALIGMRIDF